MDDAVESRQTNLEELVPLTELRPLPKVCQSTPKVRRTEKQVNRLGRTRIPTDTPEMEMIESQHLKQKEKLEKTRRRLQPIENTKRTAKRKVLKTKVPCTSTIVIESF